MDARLRGFRFRWFLPITQLLVCILILWPYWPGLSLQLWASIHGRAPLLPSLEQLPPGTKIEIVVPPPPQRQRKLDLFDMRMNAPAALNLPVGFIQLPYVISNPEKTEWVPRGMFFQMWRAMSWPFFGIVFWWMAGRGVEGFVAALRRAISPRLRWIEVALGLLLFVFGANLPCAFRKGSPNATR